MGAMVLGVDTECSRASNSASTSLITLDSTAKTAIVRLAGVQAGPIHEAYLFRLIFRPRSHIRMCIHPERVKTIVLVIFLDTRGNMSKNMASDVEAWQD